MAILHDLIEVNIFAMATDKGDKGDKGDKDDKDERDANV